MFSQENFLIILSSPSGAGKTSLAKMLLDKDSSMCWSVSCTTRSPRDQEVHGQDYYFLSKEEFDDHVSGGNFLEHAKVFHHSYGTLKKSVDSLIEQRKNVIFDVDWQGAKAIGQKTYHRCIKIFIFPPSLEVLEERLRKRNQNSLDQVNLRLSQARLEIAQWRSYDYAIVNDNLDRAFEKLWHIIQAERLKVSHLTETLLFQKNF